MEFFGIKCTTVFQNEKGKKRQHLGFFEVFRDDKVFEMNMVKVYNVEEK